MSDEYTIAGNFQRTDDPRAKAEYEYRMRRVREREADLDAAFATDAWACIPICDFCRFYNFNAEQGAYTGDGRCGHPEHPRPSEPFDGCADFECCLCGEDDDG
jgi:hypothetical protein